MGVLVWSECAGAEHAQIGGLEFFVAETARGAVLYTDASSFDQGYGGSSCPSVEAAKEDAEETARHVYDALSEALAPVLRWRKMREGRLLGVLGDWALDAYEDQFVVLYRNIDLGGGRAVDLASAQASAMERLRKIGVAFRVDRKDGE